MTAAPGRPRVNPKVNPKVNQRPGQVGAII